jgi:hypothetical protein
MAVDHSGTAYVAFTTGDIFLVDVNTPECVPSGLVAGQQGFSRFGMGFAANGRDPSSDETLYLASTGSASRLAWLDTTALSLQVIGEFNPPISEPELTGTGAGELYAFTDLGGGDSAIVRVDPTTGSARARSVLPGIRQGTGWAFAFWGGDFYTFTAPFGNSVVTRFRPVDGSLEEIATVSEKIVGAGVSTCAPTE